MSQLDSSASFAFVLGQFIGLQKHQVIQEKIALALGGEKAATVFAEQLFQIAHVVQYGEPVFHEPHHNS